MSRQAALRLVETKDMGREEWLQIRKRGIGSSDAAAAVGSDGADARLTAGRRGGAVVADTEAATAK